MTRIVILTGAGISAESGLGTFRDAGGLWETADLSALATPEGFAADPDRVREFYDQRRRDALAAAPNPAHVSLAQLQRARSDTLTLVTQNIDDLHERAGATDVVHMHGKIMEALCASCAHAWPNSGDQRGTVCPACGDPAGVRPNVVWFGEMPHRMDRIADALSACDLFVAIGTSGAVYPAAGFVAEAAAGGAETLEINLDASDTSDLFDHHIRGPAGVTVPAWVAELPG